MRKAHNGFERNPFRRGSKVYACGVCGRMTRDTGAQSFGSDLCPQCWDLAGIENEISDGYRTAAEAAPEVRALMAQVAARGGTPSFDYDLPEEAS